MEHFARILFTEYRIPYHIFNYMFIGIKFAFAQTIDKQLQKYSNKTSTTNEKLVNSLKPK